MVRGLYRQKTNLEKSEKGRPHVRIGFQNLTADVEWRHCGHDLEANGGQKYILFSLTGSISEIYLSV